MKTAWPLAALLFCRLLLALACAATGCGQRNQALPIIARLESAAAAKDGVQAQSALAEVPRLNPPDARLADLRAKVVTPPSPAVVRVDLSGGIKMEFVLIYPGSFMRGTDTGSDKPKPGHKVTLTKPFYLGKYEVTQEQWVSVMGNNPSYFKGPKRPVENVSWNDCQSFLKQLAEKTGRQFLLPTEAEWEYACRAGTSTRYSFGDSEARLPEYGWFTVNSGGTTHPVGEKQPNPWGLYDMHGNVCEWCVAGENSPSPRGDMTDPSGSLSRSRCVVYGGAWFIPAASLHSAYHHAAAKDFRASLVGFRCVLVRLEAFPEGG